MQIITCIYLPRFDIFLISRHCSDQNDTPPPDESLLSLHGRNWTECPEPLTIDPASNQLWRQPTTILWKPEDRQVPTREKTPLHYFLHFYPMNTIDNTVMYTNDRLRPRGYIATDRNELLQWLGIRLRMCIWRLPGGYTAYWERNSSDPISLGKIDFSPIMSSSRFNLILDCLAFCPLRAGISVDDVS